MKNPKCPRCNSSFTRVVTDSFGTEFTCVTCGYSSDIATVPEEILRSVALEGGKTRLRNPTMTQARR